MKLQFLSAFGLASAVSVLVSTPVSAQIAEVTGVRLNPTPGGVEVILETKDGKPLQAFSASYGQTFFADVITSKLRLPGGNAFRADNPAPGIASVTVAPLDGNSIRVTVIGETGVPTAQVNAAERGLVLSLRPTSGTTATRPAPLPTPTRPGEPGMTPVEPVQPPGEPSTQLPPVTPTQPSAEPGAVVPPVEPTRPPTQPGAVVPPVEPTRPPTQTPSEEQLEIVVTGRQQTRYAAPSATTATRTDTPLRDVPQSIQVIPQQVLEDQQVFRLDEALRNASGVRADDSFAGTLDRINIRGFSQDVFLRNGFRQSQFGLRETANVERLEVLKGPASVLYGNIQPGGVVNLVTKQPLSEPFYFAELSVGSFATYRPRIDISGPLNPDRSLRYRLNASYETSDGFRDFNQNVQRSFVAPVLSWNISDKTNLTLEFDYLNDKRPFDEGIVAIGDGIADIPYDRILTNLDAENRNEEFGGSYQLEHRFSENWTLRNSFRALSSNVFNFRLTSWFIEDSGLFERRWRSNDDLFQSFGLQTDLVGKFRTGPVNHTLLVGVDLNRQTRGGTQRGLPEDPGFSIDIFNPVLETEKPGLSDLTNFLRDNKIRTDTAGFYIQDQIALLNNLKLLLGGRFDLLDQETNNFLTDTNFNQQDNAFSPRIGLVYQPIEPISLYASFSRSFTPSSAIGFDGSTLEPEKATQYEVGIKAEFLNGGLSATVAAFDITKQNIPTIDPNNPDFSIPIGEVRSRGIELDVVGRITQGWNIIASYAYTDAEITESNDFTAGTQLYNVPKHSASLWTTYELTRGSLRGLGLGFGLFFVGDRTGDPSNTFKLPSYLLGDAAIYYRTGNLRAGLNFKNIFNVNYIRSSSSFRESVYPGDPFTVLGTVSIEF